MNKVNWWLLWETVVFLGCLLGVVAALVAINVVTHG